MQFQKSQSIWTSIPAYSACTVSWTYFIFCFQQQFIPYTYMLVWTLLSSITQASRDNQAWSYRKRMKGKMQNKGCSWVMKRYLFKCDSACISLRLVATVQEVPQSCKSSTTKPSATRKLTVSILVSPKLFLRYDWHLKNISKMPLVALRTICGQKRCILALHNVLLCRNTLNILKQVFSCS